MKPRRRFMVIREEQSEESKAALAKIHRLLQSMLGLPEEPEEEWEKPDDWWKQ